MWSTQTKCFGTQWIYSKGNLEVKHKRRPKTFQAKIQNMYGAMMQKNWNSLQKVKTRKQHLLDMEHNQTVQTHRNK